VAHSGAPRGMLSVNRRGMITVDGRTSWEQVNKKKLGFWRLGIGARPSLEKRDQVVALFRANGEARDGRKSRAARFA
jgi:hypothetical protein